MKDLNLQKYDILGCQLFVDSTEKLSVTRTPPKFHFDARLCTLNKADFLNFVEANFQ